MEPITKIKKNKGQAVNATIVAVGLLSAVATSAGNWMVEHVFNSPDVISAKIETVQNDLGARVSKQETIISTLCNDYGQTVSRMDQNIQNISKALKVPVVTGKANSDPCK